MFYAYTAISPQGQRVKGMIRARNRQHLSEILLKSEDLQILFARRAWENPFLRWFQSTPWEWLQHFFFQLSCLLRAGVPVPDALKSLKEMETSRYRQWVVGDLLYKVERGRRLSDILKKHPRDFPSLVPPIVEVGEVSGSFGKAFEDLSSYARWRHENQQKIRQTMRYPLLVLTLVVGLIIFLMMFVAPSLLSFLETSGDVEQSQKLTFMVEFFTYWGPWILGASFFLGLGVFVGMKASPKIHYRIQGILWRMPFYGSIMPPIIRTRFFHALSLLVEGGIPLLDALPLAAKATQRTFFETHVSHLLQKMRSGVSLENALLHDKVLLNPLHKHLLCVAEKSGEMEKVLKELCRLSQEEMMRKVNTLTGWLEPSLLLFLGGIMGWIAWSIFQPIYDQLGSIGATI